MDKKRVIFDELWEKDTKIQEMELRMERIVQIMLVASIVNQRYSVGRYVWPNGIEYDDNKISDFI